MPEENKSLQIPQRQDFCSLNNISNCIINLAINNI